LTAVFDHVARPADRGDFEYSSAETMVYNILLQDISVALVNPGPAEKSSVDVWTEIGEMRIKVAQRQQERNEQQRRLRFELATRLRRALSLAEQGGGGIPGAEWEAMSRLLADLKRVEDRPVFDRTLQSYLLEFHRKFATPFACVAFVVFAFPVGLLARRSGRMIGFGVGIVMSGLYWAMLIVSFRFGARSSFSPALSMWLPNVVVLAAGAALFAVRARK
jgi:lipopolysaccharide export system permease protein